MQQMDRDEHFKMKNTQLKKEYEQILAKLEKCRKVAALLEY